MNIWKRNKQFTLLEIVCVLAISMLILGIVIGRVGKLPAFISLDKCSGKVMGVLSEASNQAIAGGKTVTVKFLNRKFTVSKKNKKINSGYKDFLNYTLPEGIKVNFIKTSPTAENTFTFYPDGSIDAPTIKLSLRKHVAVINISKLTGIANVKYE